MKRDKKKRKVIDNLLQEYKLPPEPPKDREIHISGKSRKKQS